MILYYFNSLMIGLVVVGGLSFIGYFFYQMYKAHLDRQRIELIALTETIFQAGIIVGIHARMVDMETFIRMMDVQSSKRLEDIETLKRQVRELQKDEHV